jgi:dipeptidyl aminopeptidase/acylaminoacyl peptidase
MLVHGMQDDNVHPNNAWSLAQRLYDRNFDFELMLFPNAGHGDFGQAEDEAKWRFFKEHLSP